MSEAKHTPETFIDNFLFAAANDDNLRRLPITATLVEIAVEAVNNHDRLKTDRDGLLEALVREHATNLAILNVLSEAYDRFTDNDMHPPNHKLKTWLAMARTCLQHGSSELSRAAIAKAEGEEQA